jgi:hypothetical protein
MRLHEFASAEEQLALWKLVSDSVWSAVAQQAKQEAAARAEKARLARLKPRAAVPPPKPRIAPRPPPLPKPIKPAQTNLSSASNSPRKAAGVGPA